MSSKKHNLIASFISKATCPNSKSQEIYRDTQTEGLGLRVTPKDVKTFVFESGFNGSSIRMTIGGVDTWTIDMARKRAKALKVLTDQGIDPRVEVAKVKANQIAQRAKGVSGLEAWEEYVRWGKSRNEPWGVRHLQDHLDMVKAGGGIVTRGLKKGRANIKQDGALYNLLNQPLKDITRNKVENWLNFELKTRPSRSRLNLAMLRAFFNWLSTHNVYKLVIQAGVCEGFNKQLPKAKAKDDALEKEQLFVWFSHVNQLPNKTIKTYLQALLLTGARRNELATLKWEDLDLQWFKATIRDKIQGTRQIPITPYLASILNDLPRINEYVFASSRSECGYLTEPTKAHIQALQNAGLPHLSIHGVRRSFGTLAEWVECPEGITHQIMGHKPSGIAEKHYRKRPIDLLRMWHTKIEQFILKEARIPQPSWDELRSKKNLRLVA